MIVTVLRSRIHPEVADRLKALGIDNTLRGKEIAPDHTAVWCEFDD